MRMSKPRAPLDRTAAHDLWRKTISQIPSVLGRLVYLSGLRNANSGRYEHHGLAAVVGLNEAEEALKISHFQAFQEWVEFRLEEQKADLDLYLGTLNEPKREVVETWILTLRSVSLLPASIHGVEREVFLSDLDALFETLKNLTGAAGPDREE